MLTEQEHYTCVQSAVQSRQSTSPVSVAIEPPQINVPTISHDRLFEFAANAPVTLAERHPHLTVFAISVAVLLTAITAEIDCLTGSGYFWR